MHVLQSFLNIYFHFFYAGNPGAIMYICIYLYILYIEPLHRKIQNCIQGIRLGSAIIKTTGFVDDVTIYIQGKEDLNEVEKITQNFEKTTNSRLNRSKCTIMGIGKWEEGK